MPPAARRSTEPVLLTGPPESLHATLSLANTSEGRLSVKDLVLRREGAEDIGVRFAAILPPGVTTSVPVSVALPATTPPGEYIGELEIAGQSRTATIRIEPKLAASLSPARVLATAGVTPLELRLTSKANVDIPLAAHTRGRTEDGGPDPGPDIELELDAPGVLHPGESLVLTGSLRVPDGLDPTRRHEALVPIGVNDLTVLVLPRDPRTTTSTTTSTTATTKTRTTETTTTKTPSKKATAKKTTKKTTAKKATSKRSAGPSTSARSAARSTS